MDIENFDRLEALTSRFARLTDLIISKLFRSIDAMELETGGSILDVVNRAAKRGIVDSVDKIRTLKDLRNEIAHEYATADLTKIFEKVLRLTTDVLKLSVKTENYCQKYFT
jgi:uncharacterized protein YutE (UPF0331/DUF86 family)